MESWIDQAAGYIALFLEITAALVIAFGALAAIFGLLRPMRDGDQPRRRQKEVYLRFGEWILMGLEFALAADIVKTVVAPTWQEIGQLAAIAAIRTFLNYFLEKDIENHARQEDSPPG
jgi:uncharacterized membrane protein